MTLRLIKVENGLCQGAVLFSEYGKWISFFVSPFALFYISRESWITFEELSTSPSGDGKKNEDNHEDAENEEDGDEEEDDENEEPDSEDEEEGD